MPPGRSHVASLPCAVLGTTGQEGKGRSVVSELCFPLRTFFRPVARHPNKLHFYGEEAAGCMRPDKRRSPSIVFQRPTGLASLDARIIVKQEGFKN